MSANTSVGAGTQVRRGLREVARLAALPQPWVWVASITILGFLMRRYHLGNESLWFDEADIVWRARQPLDVLAQGFLEAGENGPLYTLILHYWLALLETLPQVAGMLHLLLGVSYEAPVRGLSATFGTAAIPLMYALARRVGGHWLGIAAAALLTINPFHIWHSQDAKMYTMLVMMALASTLLYMLALERGTPLLWAGYVVATWIMLTTHSMAGLVLLAQLVSTPSLLKNRRPAQGEEDAAPNTARRRWWLGWGWAMLLILAPLFPIAWLRAAALITNTVDVGGWYQATGLTDILATIFVTFAVNRAPQPWEAIGAISVAVLAALGTWFLLKPRKTRNDHTEATADNPSPITHSPFPLVLSLW
ncbi:MAG: glycosyltransferase family 39 protein, partial [Chloroflexota bacterium]|nr:glycosyltransferase family 39 protein [Chloroflexota bacterium]